MHIEVCKKCFQDLNSKETMIMRNSTLRLNALGANVNGDCCGK